MQLANVVANYNKLPKFCSYNAWIYSQLCKWNILMQLNFGKVSKYCKIAKISIRKLQL